MDCRETQTLLTAFHDEELHDADRARVEEHLRGCPECGGLLADLARVDEAAGVPDPGPGYWDRFNARVEDRIEREAEGPRVAVLRPKRGWMRQQLRFLVPAVAAAALVVVVVRYGGRNPVAPTPTVPPAVAVNEQSGLDSAEQRMAKSELPPPAIAKERFPTLARAREERDRLADRLQSEENERTSQDRAAAPAEIGAPSPPPLLTYRSAPAGSPPVTVADGRPSKAQVEQKKMAGAAAPVVEPKLAAKAESASGMRMEKHPSAAPCGMARTLAAQGRLREAETAQRACLAQDPSPPTQEKGLIFLAELLDRQARFAEADTVLTEVHRQFPKSLPLDLYRQQRPMVQKQQMPVPVTR
jgi:TolA-binding protein